MLGFPKHYLQGIKVMFQFPGSYCKPQNNNFESIPIYPVSELSFHEVHERLVLPMTINDKVAVFWIGKMQEIPSCSNWVVSYNN